MWKRFDLLPSKKNKKCIAEGQTNFPLLPFCSSQSCPRVGNRFPTFIQFKISIALVIKPNSSSSSSEDFLNNFCLLSACISDWLRLFELLQVSLKAYRLSELTRCFILIAVEIFHNIIHKWPRTKEIRCCLIFFHPGKNSMLTHPIFIRPDSELIRASICACAKLFVDEENVG